ncbi:hypothetical protein EVAR_93731_1 [Eumeta japonica]|uniref:Uncharacterized protein n=1 Tax=Eumeta variegata TaxID=151549 RepID=A0A4C1U3D8_EUMVA|nr:hypothetical protein EVAR_93731_1 [Eumeta japonica]
MSDLHNGTCWGRVARSLAFEGGGFCRALGGYKLGGRLEIVSHIHEKCQKLLYYRLLNIADALADPQARSLREDSKARLF